MTTKPPATRHMLASHSARALQVCPFNEFAAAMPRYLTLFCLSGHFCFDLHPAESTFMVFQPVRRHSVIQFKTHTYRRRRGAA